MKPYYEDIMNATSMVPKWWDENGTPRFTEFKPELTPDIHAKQCCLVRISCQNCGTIFNVGMSSGYFHRQELSKRVQDNSLHYGDPPNNLCCPAGPTMNCNDLRVIEFWNKKEFEWERIPFLEVLLPDHPDFEKDKSKV